MTIYERLINSVASFILSTEGVAALIIVSHLTFFIALYVLSKHSRRHEPFIVRAFNATVTQIAIASMLIVYIAINTSQIHESSNHKISQFYDRSDTTIYDTHQIVYDANKRTHVAKVKDKEIVLDKYDNLVNDTFDDTTQVLRVTTYRAKESKRELLRIWHKSMTLYVGELIEKRRNNGSWTAD